MAFVLYAVKCGLMRAIRVTFGRPRRVVIILVFLPCCAPVSAMSTHVLQPHRCLPPLACSAPTPSPAEPVFDLSHLTDELFGSTPTSCAPEESATSPGGGEPIGEELDVQSRSSREGSPQLYAADVFASAEKALLNIKTTDSEEVGATQKRQDDHTIASTKKILDGYCNEDSLRGVTERRLKKFKTKHCGSDAGFDTALRRPDIDALRKAFADGEPVPVPALVTHFVAKGERLRCDKDGWLDSGRAGSIVKRLEHSGLDIEFQVPYKTPNGDDGHLDNYIKISKFVQTATKSGSGQNEYTASLHFLLLIGMNRVIDTGAAPPTMPCSFNEDCDPVLAAKTPLQLYKKIVGFIGDLVASTTDCDRDIATADVMNLIRLDCGESICDLVSMLFNVTHNLQNVVDHQGLLRDGAARLKALDAQASRSDIEIGDSGDSIGSRVRVRRAPNRLVIE